MDFNLANFLYEEDSLGIFVLVSLIMGGGAAFLSGRAIAATWRPWWHVIFYMVLLAAGVRFIHFALFEGTLLTIHYYLVDYIICLAVGFLGFQATRVSQMATQYRWIYARSGILTWAARDGHANRG